MTEQRKHRNQQPERLQELLEQGMVMPQVAAALAVFQAASLRAPYIPPSPPEVRFTTGGNA
ncbi:MAG: hypothetical protein ACRDRR_12380 [Pseudonocardiaceae bacterium]